MDNLFYMFAVVLSLVAMYVVNLILNGQSLLQGVNHVDCNGQHHVVNLILNGQSLLHEFTDYKGKLSKFVVNLILNGQSLLLKNGNK